jgi:hypothetical protein
MNSSDHRSDMRSPLAQRLREAAQQHRNADSAAATQRLDLSTLMGLHGESSVAVLLMLLAVVSVLPVAGAGTVMSLGIWTIAWAWLRAHNSVQLPTRLGQVKLNARWSGRCLHGLAWIYEQSNRCLRPRWALWSHTGTRLWWGSWIAIMGLVIFLPLPLGNVLPALSLILLSLGWMFRDGLALLLSCATGAAAVAYVVWLWDWVSHAVLQAWAALPW